MSPDERMNKESGFVPSSQETPSPSTDIELQSDWTQPKSRQISAANQLTGFMEPLNQDITTGFLDDNIDEVVTDHLLLSNDALEFSNANDIQLTGYQRFIGRIIGSFVNVSKGKNGNLLKVMKTNWNINENKKNFEDLEDLKKKEMQMQRDALVNQQRRNPF